MRNLLRNATLFTKIEFWAVTTIFGFVIFFFLIDGFDGPSAFDDSPYLQRFEDAGIEFRFYKHFYIPQLIRDIWLYISVVAINFIIVPRIITRQSMPTYIGLLVILMVVTTLVFGVTGTYMQAYQYGTGGKDEVDQSIMYEEGVLFTLMFMFVLFVYIIIKYGAGYLYNVSEAIQSKYKFIRREAIVATAFWLVAVLLLVIGEADTETVVGWIIVVPSAIALYLASFHTLIPRSLKYKNYQFFFYVLRCAFILFVGFFAIYLVFAMLTGDSDAGAGYSAFNTFFQLFITVPITWVLYKKYLRGNEEITVLKQELKQSSANIDFLRSQINPHFLFNALNTLYGTAIQENAERTSEGIQKLGDMMRFMLQENMQDKISLAREVDYLNNYISLQKLRTDSHPNVSIQTEIQDRENYYQIAPMLLIPFVENAFKHGISFRETSHIKINLEVKDGVLEFDVYNSKHLRKENDPEKDKSGIGLENVKQRLILSYPNKHELIIRDTTKEFFVHLTVQLAKFA